MMKSTNNVKVIFRFLDYNRSGLTFVKATHMQYVQYVACAKGRKKSVRKKNKPCNLFCVFVSAAAEECLMRSTLKQNSEIKDNRLDCPKVSH